SRDRTRRTPERSRPQGFDRQADTARPRAHRRRGRSQTFAGLPWAPFLHAPVWLPSTRFRECRRMIGTHRKFIREGTMYKHLLVPTDGPKLSHKAFAQEMALAKGFEPE